MSIYIFSNYLSLLCFQSLAFGPGLLDGCCSGFRAAFQIVAKDTHGNDRISGRDEFSINIIDPDGTKVFLLFQLFFPFYFLTFFLHCGLLGQLQVHLDLFFSPPPFFKKKKLCFIFVFCFNL